MGLEEKVKHLIDVYGIPRENSFNSRDTSFNDGLMEETANKGVDSVLNSLSGELLICPGNVLQDSGPSSRLENETFLVVAN